MRISPARKTSLTATEAAILGLLGKGEQSGYDIKRGVARSVGYFWAPARSQIYAVLPRLVEQGLATRRDVRQTGRPDKQLYRITNHGLETLRDWLESQPLEPEPDRNLLLLKVFFGEHADPAAILEQVRERRRAAEQLRRELDELEPPGAGTGEDRFPALTRRYGYEHAEAVIRWADWVEQELA